MDYIHRYGKWECVVSNLNPLEDCLCWIEGLTSINYCKDLLASRPNEGQPMTIDKRAESLSKLVYIACKYLEQAMHGPKEVSFLSIYYAMLNFIKAYIVIGPYGDELDNNRWHGARYDWSRAFTSLTEDQIIIARKGTIPLFYRTVVGEDIFLHLGSQRNLKLKMGEIYPYIVDVRAEYGWATKQNTRLFPFQVNVVQDGDKKRVVAEWIDTPAVESPSLNSITIKSLQAFQYLRRESIGSKKLVSKLYKENVNESDVISQHLRPNLLYGVWNETEGEPVNLIASSKEKILLPEELPILLAFFHLSNLVRYDPEGLRQLMDSKYWPTALALRNHGLYRFIILFWSYVNQCCTYISPQS